MTPRQNLEPATGGAAWEGRRRVTIGTATRSGVVAEGARVNHSTHNQVLPLHPTGRSETEELLAGVAVPVSGIAAIILTLSRPISGATGQAVLAWVDFALAMGLVACAVAAWSALRLPWCRGGRLLLIPLMLTLVYLVPIHAISRRGERRSNCAAGRD